MATYVAEAGGGDWTAEATWDLASGFPDSDDIAELAVGSGAVTLDANVDIASFDASAYEDDFLCADFDMLVSGDFKFKSATATWADADDCQVTIDGDGDLENAGYANTIKELVVVDGVTATLTANCFTKKASPAGTIDGAKALYIFGPTAAWWNQTGSGAVECDVVVRNATAGPGGAVTLSDTDLTVLSSLGDKTLTLDADVSVGAGTIKLETTGAGDDQTLTGTGVLTASLLQLSTHTGAGASCTANLTGETHFIGAINGTAQGENGAQNILALGTCNIQSMTTGLDGANLTVTADSVHLYGNGSTTTIKNVDISAAGTIWCHGFDEAGSTGNHEDSDIRFVGGAGGQMLMGVGA